MTEYTNESNIICPYCGWEDEDSWETQEGDDEYSCGFCEKKFVLEVEHSVSYSTKRIPCKNDKHKLNEISNSNWIKDDEWDYKTDIRTKLPKDKWEYVEKYDCEECDECEYKDLTEEEYVKKYPFDYDKVLSHHRLVRNSEGEKKNG